jgi:hypothetical protein
MGGHTVYLQCYYLCNNIFVPVVNKHEGQVVCEVEKNTF